MNPGEDHSHILKSNLLVVILVLQDVVSPHVYHEESSIEDLLTGKY